MKTAACCSSPVLPGDTARPLSPSFKGAPPLPHTPQPPPHPKSSVFSPERPSGTRTQIHSTDTQTCTTTAHAHACARTHTRTQPWRFALCCSRKKGSRPLCLLPCALCPCWPTAPPPAASSPLLVPQTPRPHSCTATSRLCQDSRCSRRRTAHPWQLSRSQRQRARPSRDVARLVHPDVSQEDRAAVGGAGC